MIIILSLIAAVLPATMVVAVVGVGEWCWKTTMIMMSTAMTMVNKESWSRMQRPYDGKVEWSHRYTSLSRRTSRNNQILYKWINQYKLQRCILLDGCIICMAIAYWNEQLRVYISFIYICMYTWMHTCTSVYAYIANVYCARVWTVYVTFHTIFLIDV